ncbi:hypothetical protein UlMin_017006 [Ulmus minor]
MCSTNGGGGTSGDGGDDGVCWNPNYKKTLKRQRVPKRGPGVAELEKILRDQEKKNDVVEDFPAPLLSPLSSKELYEPFKSHLPRPSPPMTTTLNPLNLKHHHHRNVSPPPPPPMATINNMSTFLGEGLGGSGGDGSGGVFVNEKVFFPLTWGKSENLSLPEPFHNMSNSIWSSAPSVEKKQCLNQQINHFLGSASSSSNQSSVGLMYHPIEPPSNQISYHNYPSMELEEEKVVGIKRRPPPLLSVDNPSSIFNFQVPPVRQAHMHQQDMSTSYNHGIGCHPNQSKIIPCREAKWDVPLVSNYSYNYSSTDQYGAVEGNCFKFRPQNAISPPLPTFQNLHFSKVDMPLSQETEKRSISAEPNPNKPFYRFLPSKEQMGTKDTLGSLNNERGDKAGGDDIDLRLKL